MDASSAVVVGEKLRNGDRVVGTFLDKYEQPRVLLRGRRGVRVQHKREAEAYEYSKAIAPLVAARIKAERKARGWRLVGFAERLGWQSGNAKERVWAIENATRGNGMLMGTLFHVAEVLGIPYRDLLPTDEAVRAAIKARRARSK